MASALLRVTLMMTSPTSRFQVLPVLGVLCGLLLIGLLYRHTIAYHEKGKNVATIAHYSNQWVQTSEKLREQTAVNLAMEREFGTQGEELVTLSNSLVTATADLATARSQAEEASANARQRIQQQEARIVELESQRDEVAKTLTELTASISNLETQITETKQKLAESNSNRDGLMAELKRLQAEKAQLERKFYDLAMLRQQMRALRSELSMNRRLEWIRRGLYGSLKGGELLHKQVASASPAPSKVDLEVEVGRERAAKVVSNPAP